LREEEKKRKFKEDAKYALLQYLGIPVRSLASISDRAARDRVLSVLGNSKPSKSDGKVTSLIGERTGIDNKYWKTAFHINKKYLGKWSSFNLPNITSTVIETSDGRLTISEVLEFILKQKDLIGFIWLSELETQQRHSFPPTVIFSNTFEGLKFKSKSNISMLNREKPLLDRDKFDDSNMLKDEFLAKLFNFQRMCGRTSKQSSRFLSNLTGQAYDIDRADYVKYASEFKSISDIKSNSLRKGARSRELWIEKITTHLNKQNTFASICIFHRKYAEKTNDTSKDDTEVDWFILDD
jgi:hypothetical protein